MFDQIFVRRIELKALQVVGYSVSDAARAINIDRPQIYRYIKIARIRVSDYRQAEQAAKKKSPKRPLLCSYQVWVLAKIRGLFKEVRDEKRVREIVYENPEEFSLTTFLTEQEHGQETSSQETKPYSGRGELSIA